MTEMSYRDAQQAALARIAALEAELARLKQSAARDESRSRLERELQNERALLAAERARLEVEQQAELAIAEQRARLRDAELEHRDALHATELDQLRAAAEELRADLWASEEQRRALEEELEILLEPDAERIRRRFLELERAAVRELKGLAAEQAQETAAEGARRAQLEAELRRLEGEDRHGASVQLGEDLVAGLRLELEALRGLARARAAAIGRRHAPAAARLARARRVLAELARRGG